MHVLSELQSLVDENSYSPLQASEERYWNVANGKNFKTDRNLSRIYTCEISFHDLSTQFKFLSMPLKMFLPEVMQVITIDTRIFFVQKRNIGVEFDSRS